MDQQQTFYQDDYTIEAILEKEVIKAPKLCDCVEIAEAYAKKVNRPIYIPNRHKEVGCSKCKSKTSSCRVFSKYNSETKEYALICEDCTGYSMADYMDWFYQNHPAY